MAKNNKGKNIPNKPAIQAPKEEKNATKVEVIDVNHALNEMKKVDPKSTTGLDLDHQVDLAMLNAKYFHDDPNARQKYGDDIVDNMEKLNVCLIASINVQEALTGKSTFAFTVRREQLPVIQSVCESMGIVLDTKALPAPTKENTDTVEIKVDNLKPTKEVKDKVKKEEKIVTAAEPNYDPTKIENDEQLAATLLSILRSGSRIFDNFTKASNFYASVLKLRASKSKDSEAELKRIGSMSQAELFESVAKLIGSTPFILSGFSKHLCTTVGVTGNPVSAFLSLKATAKNRKTGKYAATDDTIAAMAKTLIGWSATTSIEDCEKNIKVLEESDKEKNKGAIEQNQTNIAYFNRIIEAVTNPSFDVASKLFENYSADKNSPEYKNSHRIFDGIMETYYPETNVNDIEPSSLKHNVSQRVGIIINLFTDCAAQNNNYSPALLTEMQMIEKENSKEEKEESASKK